MTREQLEHILRAASRIADDPDVLVIGSQSILGSFAEDQLPFEATASMEADIAFFGDPDDAKADLVDGPLANSLTSTRPSATTLRASASPRLSFRKVGETASSPLPHQERLLAAGCA
ncbi:MAG TPA: hypothetical protein VN961_23175 [Streptosporangiaceae bacterium]|nr:hypothetical protein [Streptosporangiaceae bacterium]